ncbi:MAG: AAA family ATPase [Candidatus Thermoplasmatota archaeon]
MLISITGTPGTGKTTVSKILKKDGYNVIDLNSISKEFIIGYDKKRKTSIVDIKKLDRKIRNYKKNNKKFLIGHLSHLLSVDYVFILRCNPLVLKLRLKKKKYNNQKIKENICAEAIDYILLEAYRKHRNRIWEIDTTNKKPKDVAREIVEVLKLKKFSEYKIGNIDWSNEIYENPLDFI